MLDNSNTFALARLAEDIDARNWLDDFAAAPPKIADSLDLAAASEGPLHMVRSRIPFSHFNMVMTLGTAAPADARSFAAIEGFYGAARHWITVVDPCQPPNLAEQLLQRGYVAAGAWDRVVMSGSRPDAWAPLGAGCEMVTAANMAEWSAFLLRSYGMPQPVASWLQALVGRHGWFHALWRDGGVAGAPVAMVRSLFLGDDGWAWLGIDAPVPGVMAPCYAHDQRVTAALLTAAARAGAHSFVSDIELPSPEREGPAYSAWRELGFEAVYLRRLFVKG